MKNLSARERIIVTALPAALVLMIYYFFVASPANKEIERLRRQIDTAQTRVPSSLRLANTAKELKMLLTEVNVKRQKIREREERRNQLLAYWTNAEAKALSGQKISDLIAANQVVLVEEMIAEDEDRKAFAQILDSLPSAELWRLRLAGSYDAIRRTILDLGETDLPIIPAAIEMEPLVEGNKSIHLWNLWICR
ncbi:MAG: type II secretion system protein GspM [Verrucomicrobiota bacterium]